MLSALVALIGNFFHHELVDNSSDCKDVGSFPMVLVADHFWRHIPERSCVIAVVHWHDLSGKTEIGQSQVALPIKDQVFGLDVFMDHVARVDIFESLDQASYEKTYLALRESALSHLVMQIAPRHVVKHLEELLLILERVSQIDNEVTLQVLEQRKFRLD